MCHVSLRGRILVELGKGYKDVQSMPREASGQPGGAERITTWRMVKAASTPGTGRAEGIQGTSVLTLLNFKVQEEIVKKLRWLSEEGRAGRSCG